MGSSGLEPCGAPLGAGPLQPHKAPGLMPPLSIPLIPAPHPRSLPTCRPPLPSCIPPPSCKASLSLPAPFIIKTRCRSGSEPGGGSWGCFPGVLGQGSGKLSLCGAEGGINWGAAPAPQGTGLPRDPALGGFLTPRIGGVSTEGVSRCLLAPNASAASWPS